jgi:hypothetical protein
MELLEGVALPEPPGGDDTDEKDKKRIKVRVTLFFDGTKNNKTNVAMGKQFGGTDVRDDGNVQLAKVDRAAYEDLRKKWFPSMDSYENDYTNVARLEMNLNRPPSKGEFDYYFAIYTEGIGTVDRDEDAQKGYAFGQGPTGVESKVAKGVEEALKELNGIPEDEARTIIEEVVVDTCGFSRGAAAVRYCVHCVLQGDGEILKLKQGLENAGWEVGTVRVQAVGLFDTVSSHGWDSASEANESDDVAVLKLDAIRAAAAVLHLVAAEEYRERFSLTNINSAGGKGTQIYLPGAHSDVGGSYMNNADDSRTLHRGPRSSDIRSFLRSRGWYQNAELTLNFGILRSNRRGLSHKYSYIPLHRMARFFDDHEIRFRRNLSTRYNPDGVPGRDEIERYANSTTGVSNSRPWHWEIRRDRPFVTLRNRYLNISFSSGIGMAVRLVRMGDSHRPFRVVHNG